MRIRAAAFALAVLTACASAAPPHELVQTRREDTLLDLAREHDLGYLEIVAANPGVDPWLPGDETTVVLPTVHLPPAVPARGIVINLAEQRLYYFDGREHPVSYPIGVGRPGWRTPLGTTEVVRKLENPVWYPPSSARREDPSLPAVVRAGPDNPLGTHALYIGWPRYLIHGTNEPYGVGRRVSRGCIRLYPEDIVRLYERVELGTPVRVINQPIKTDWRRGELFLEVHPPFSQQEGLADVASAAGELSEELRERLRELSGEAKDRLDWALIEHTIRERRGVAVKITSTPTLAERLLGLAARLLAPSPES